jgi:hypothetical protein
MNFCARIASGFLKLNPLKEKKNRSRKASKRPWRPISQLRTRWWYPVQTFPKDGGRDFSFEHAGGVEADGLLHTHHGEAGVDVLRDEVEAVVVADEVDESLSLAKPAGTVGEECAAADFFFGEFGQARHAVFAVLPGDHAEADVASGVGGFEGEADAFHDIGYFVDGRAEGGGNADVVVDCHDELVIFSCDSADELGVVLAANGTPDVVDFGVLAVDEFAESVVLGVHGPRVVDDEYVAGSEVGVGRCEDTEHGFVVAVVAWNDQRGTVVGCR